MYPESKFFLGFWADQNHWQEWLNAQDVSHAPVLEQIRNTDENGWTPSSGWVTFQPLSRVVPVTRMSEHTSSGWVVLRYISSYHPLMRMAKYCIQRVSCSLVFEQIGNTDKMAKHTSSKWVALQCLNRSNPLTRAAEHESRMWVALPSLFKQIRTTDENGWIFI